MIKKEMKYDTFTEFVNRAEELREMYAIRDNTPSFLMDEYRNYVYSHVFKSRYEDAINNLCWDWLLSNCYDDVSINDLYSMLGQIKKGK